MPVSDSTQDGRDDARDFPIDDADPEYSTEEIIRGTDWRDGDPSSGPKELDLDEVLELLGTQRRRLALSFIAARLDDGQPAIDAPDVVDYVHERERDQSTWKATYVALHQVHLPTLDDAGVLVYDEENRTVYLGGNGDAVLAVLQAMFDAWPGGSPDNDP